MKITSLKQLDNVWLVNGKYSVPDNPASRFYADVQEAIAEGVPVEPQYTQAELDAAKMAKTVSMRQARLALLQSGRLADVDGAITALPEPDQSAVSIEWEYAQEVKRSHEWVMALGAQLGMTDAELDDLFSLAETL